MSKGDKRRPTQVQDEAFEGAVVEIERATYQGPPMYSIVLDKRKFGQFSRLLGVDLSNLKRGESTPFLLTPIDE